MNYGGVELQGLFSNLEELEDEAGVFAIFCLDQVVERADLLLVKVTEHVRTEVGTILGSDLSVLCMGRLRIGVLYGADQEELTGIREKILWTKREQ